MNTKLIVLATSLIGLLSLGCGGLLPAAEPMRNTEGTPLAPDVAPPPPVVQTVVVRETAVPQPPVIQTVVVVQTAVPQPTPMPIMVTVTTGSPLTPTGDPRGVEPLRTLNAATVTLPSEEGGTQICVLGFGSFVVNGKTTTIPAGVKVDNIVLVAGQPDNNDGKDDNARFDVRGNNPQFGSCGKVGQIKSGDLFGGFDLWMRDNIANSWKNNCGDGCKNVIVWKIDHKGDLVEKKDNFK
jgi:hypothetical protein